MSIEKAKDILTEGIEKACWPESEIMKEALAELEQSENLEDENEQNRMD